MVYGYFRLCVTSTFPCTPYGLYLLPICHYQWYFLSLLEHAYIHRSWRLYNSSSHFNDNHTTVLQFNYHTKGLFLWPRFFLAYIQPICFGLQCGYAIQLNYWLFLWLVSLHNHIRSAWPPHRHSIPNNYFIHNCLSIYYYISQVPHTTYLRIQLISTLYLYFAQDFQYSFMIRFMYSSIGNIVWCRSSTSSNYIPRDWGRWIPSDSMVYPLTFHLQYSFAMMIKIFTLVLKSSILHKNCTKYILRGSRLWWLHLHITWHYSCQIIQLTVPSLIHSGHSITCCGINLTVYVGTKITHSLGHLPCSCW